MKKRYLDFRFDVSDLTQTQREALAGEVVVQAEASDLHPGVPPAEVDYVEVEVCRACGNEIEPHPSGLCDSCETQARYDAADADDPEKPPTAPAPLENLIDRDLPVDSNPNPVRPSDEGLLVLYGDRASGVTVAVAATSEEDAERRIVATFGDGAYIDCLDVSTDQRPLSIRLVAGLIPDEETARRLLELDAESAR